MLSFEDLVAARILHGVQPHLRDLLMAGVDALEEEVTGVGLLASLVACEVITQEYSEWVHRRVEHHQLWRALGIQRHLLIREGVPEAHIAVELNRLGADAHPATLGPALAARGLLSPARANALLFEARRAFDHDETIQVQAYRATRQRIRLEASSVRPSSSTALPAISSAVFRLEQLVIPPSPQATQSLATPVLEPKEAAPGFVIPDWIDTADPATGTRLCGFRVLGRVGAGAMGVVYLADHPDEPERPVALKPLTSGNEESQGRFKREVLANSFFSHPGVLDIYDAGETEDGGYYLAMEFFDGRDLAGLLEAQKKLSPQTALSLAKLMFEALGAVHEAGIIHRDIKPENILVSADARQIKLMDFGIAILPGLEALEEEVEEVQVFHTMMAAGDDAPKILGTPMYMSPEQALGETNLAITSDLYSMALVVYEMLAGRLPFESETAQGFISCHMVMDPLPLLEANPETDALPIELHELLDQLLKKSPAKRPQSAGEVLAVLEGVRSARDHGREPAPESATPEEPGAHAPVTSELPANPEGDEAPKPGRRKTGWLWKLMGGRRR